MSKIKSEGLPDKKEPVKLFEMSATYIQDCDLGDNMQELKVSIDDQGAGKYYVIETERWAIDSTDDLIKILEDFKERL